MSSTMLLGRVVLPSVGLIMAAAVGWNLLRNLSTEAESVPLREATAASSLASDRITAEGRVVANPGAQVTVGTEILGRIINMPVCEKTAVRKGDLLVELRADEPKAAVREASQRLIEAEVGLRLERFRAQLDTIMPIGTSKDPQQQDLRRELIARALAHRDAAKAAVDRCEAEAARYRIVAPIDGVVIAQHAHSGETLNAAAPIVTIVDLHRLRVEAEVDEFDIAGVIEKSEATITAEGYPGRRWRGAVEEVADSVVARQSRPQDPGRPADTRVLLVRVAFLEPTPLKLGQRVEVEIAGRKHAP
jgi:HlyD family secretion protein